MLAIETSCDDTSAAILRGKKVLSNVTASQAVHGSFGGVIPEFASRSHEKNLIPVVMEAMTRASVAYPDINCIACTQGPGLPGSLIVGMAFSKSLAMAAGLPLITVNHMQAHVLAHFIEGVHPEPPSFPFLCLTVSGGHTQIVLVRDYLDMEVVASTIDDAAGEAFDKIATMFGLQYPGGPLIEKLAAGGDERRFTFARPRAGGFNYSFSGLKTSVLYFLREESAKNEKFVAENLHDLCASVQYTISEILLQNLEKCASHYGITSIALAGGVSANSRLRRALKERSAKHGWKTYVPPLEYCTDNAAMIGIVAIIKMEKGEFSGLDTISSARMTF